MRGIFTGLHSPQAKPPREDTSPTRERGSQAAEQALRSELSSQVTTVQRDSPLSHLLPFPRSKKTKAKTSIVLKKGV